MGFVTLPDWGANFLRNVMQLHKFSVRLSSAVLLLAAAAAPVAAADQPASPANEASVADADRGPAHATNEEPKEPKKICRSLEQTSSRLQTKKVCLTREQWRNAKYN
jgi:invasion protein IalB